MIKTLAELKATRVFPFPTRRKSFVAAVRNDGSVIAVDRRGQFYYSGLDARRGTPIGMLQCWMRARITGALKKLGVVDPAVDAEIKEVAQRERRRDDAHELLRRHEDMTKLGVPFTPEQIEKLQAIAEV